MTTRPSADLVVRLCMVATGVITVVLVAATIHPRGLVLAVAVVMSLGALAVGSALFLVGFLRAVGRSRDETITMAGLVWLTNAAPPPIARSLRALVIVQAIVAIVCAAIRPFTAVAFGVLTPMVALGCLTYWAGTHGTFGMVEPMRDAVPASVAEDEDPDDFDQLFRRRKPKK